MAKKLATRDQYLDELNNRLLKEPDIPEGARYAFYPLGSTAKTASGVTSVGDDGDPTVALRMRALQSKVYKEFVVVDEPVAQSPGRAAAADGFPPTVRRRTRE